jgi:prepilin-type N-terminal cleavage/methylation domain-containing protein
MKRLEQKGFTLIEVIVTLVVAAILGTILVQFMGTSLTRSAEPIIMVQEGFSLSEVMEKMTAHYKYLLATDSTPLKNFEIDIRNGNLPENTPYFGDYSIQQPIYITFSGGNEAPDTSGDNRILKAIISKGDQSLAALFTK